MEQRKLSIRDLDPNGTTVLMRVDFNVPLDASRRITDDTRIRAALPSINHVLTGGGRLVLMSHLGRPKGKIVPEYSLRPVADRLAELLDYPVKFAADTIGPDAIERVGGLVSGEALLLENLRYNKGETANDPAFALAMSRLADTYVNDAFGTAHRAHASTAGVTKHFDRCYAGYLMEKELEHLGGLMVDPPRPFIALLGGAKVSGKVDVISSLLDRVDCLLLGGGMIFTFFKSHGLNIGDSLLDEGSLEVVEKINEKARTVTAQMVLPEDCVLSTDFSDRGEIREELVTDIADGWQGLDIGAKTIARYERFIGEARSVFWNGPMGVFEIPRFARGTEAVGRAVAATTKAGATSIVGGGDSVAALNKLGLADGISHVSTGGGASLEFMAGRELPGIAALTDA